MKTKTITALLDTRSETDEVLAKLENAGFSDSQVAILMTEDVRSRHFKITENTKAAEGAVAGAGIAGLAAALYMAIGATGTVLIPGLNIIAAGYLVSALAGLGAGAAAGGLIGALVGAGVPEHEAKTYQKKMEHDGSVLLAVQVDTDAQEDLVKALLESAHAHDIKALSASKPTENYAR
jgi:uncharacterized membrane protein